MTRLLNRMGCLLLIAAVGTLGISAFAQEDAAPAGAVDAPAAVVDPQAKEAIDKVTQFYAGLKTVVVEATLTLENREEGQDETLNNTFNISMERPARLAMNAKGDAVNATAMTDGKQLTVFMADRNEYAVEDAPDDPASVLGMAGSGLVRVGTMIMAELFRAQPYATLLEDVQEQRYVGKEELNGKEYHHVRLVHEEIDWDMWIDAGEKPLVGKVTVDVAKVLKSVKANEIKVDMTVAYKGWAVNGELSEDTFIFTPPADAKKVDSFEPKRPESAASGLKGKPAPVFTLDLAGGGAFDLAQQKGKNVVILDFWASWCGPCRQAMPIYAKVAAEYKDKGVVFYGVNIAETPETVKKFLEQTKLDIAVALDAEGKVAGEYQAASIPMSVIIDKNGVVQVVHVGLAPNLETELRAELDAILAGKPVEE